MRDIMCQSLLHNTVASNDHVTLRRLLSQFPDMIDVYNEKGITLLMFAVMRNCLDSVRILIEAGAEVTKQTDNGIDAVGVSAFLGNLDILNYFLGILNYEQKRQIIGPTLYFAAQCGHLVIVQRLVAQGTIVDFQTTDGSTPLFIACQNGHLSVVRFLLCTKANVNLRRDDGVTPLWIASQMGHTEIVKELLKYCADVDLAREDGSSPLFKASHKGHSEVVDVLLKFKPYLGLCKNGESALHAACLFGHFNVVESLVLAGADLKLHNRLRETPIELAQQMGYDEIVEYLLKFDSL